MSTLTIRIPASMERAIEVTSNLVTPDQAPIYCAGADRDNPDDFCLAFYADLTSDSVEENHRASMMAEVINPGEPSTVLGDVLMVADATLCQRIVDNDQEFQEHKRSVQAFRAWLLDYSNANDKDPAVVFEAVHSYAVHVQEETMRDLKNDQVARIAHLLGLDPAQVGVFFV